MSKEQQALTPFEARYESGGFQRDLFRGLIYDRISSGARDMPRACGVQSDGSVNSGRRCCTGQG